VNKVVLVTGGRRSTGKAIADRFSSEGWDVYSVGHSNLEHNYVVDFALDDWEDIASCVDACLDERGRIDAIVNCSGVTKIQWIEALEPEDWCDVMRVNVTAPFAIIQRLLQLVQGGLIDNEVRVVNIISMAHKYALRASTPYNASKAAMVAVTKQIAREVADRYPNVLVFGLSPGGIEGSDMVEKVVIPAMVKVRSFTEEGARKYNVQSPLGRNCTMDEVSEVAYWLATNAPSYLTGTNVDFMGAGQ
jgi:NAD(P)-dependent dehydrogenase (short-subunit alcohol dehydrogenase family)